jgi:hypothetical protein
MADLRAERARREDMEYRRQQSEREYGLQSRRMGMQEKSHVEELETLRARNKYLERIYEADLAGKKAGTAHVEARTAATQQGTAENKETAPFKKRILEAGAEKEETGVKRVEREEKEAVASAELRRREREAATKSQEEDAALRGLNVAGKRATQQAEIDLAKTKAAGAKQGLEQARQIFALEVTNRMQKLHQAGQQIGAATEEKIQRSLVRRQHGVKKIATMLRTELLNNRGKLRSGDRQDLINLYNVYNPGDPAAKIEVTEDNELIVTDKDGDPPVSYGQLSKELLDAITEVKPEDLATIKFKQETAEGRIKRIKDSVGAFFPGKDDDPLAPDPNKLNSRFRAPLEKIALDAYKEMYAASRLDDFAGNDVDENDVASAIAVNIGMLQPLKLDDDQWQDMLKDEGAKGNDVIKKLFRDFENAVMNDTYREVSQREGQAPGWSDAAGGREVIRGLGVGAPGSRKGESQWRHLEKINKAVAPAQFNDWKSSFYGTDVDPVEWQNYLVNEVPKFKNPVTKNLVVNYINKRLENAGRRIQGTPSLVPGIGGMTIESNPREVPAARERVNPPQGLQTPRFL